MRISTDAFITDIAPAVDWIGGLIGAALDKRVAAFEQQERAHPLLTAHFRESFALEFALYNARKYRKNTGRLPKGEEYDPLYSFLIPAHRIHVALPAAAKAPFEGRLRDAVNGACGARPFAYEISIAAHLMRKNWDVEFVDYSGAARFDFLARQGTVEVEIECKTTSRDTGRKIHLQEVNRLADLILPTRLQLADIAGCHRILVTIPDRLGRSNNELFGIASVIAQAAEQKTPVSTALARAEYIFDDIASWPDPNIDAAGALAFFEERFGKQNSHLVFHGRPGFSVIAVMIASAKADSVVDAIGAEAKEAANQCSGTRPALIALHLVDQLSPSDLQELLENPSGIHAITHAVFRGMNRLHVDTVAFSVPQAPRTDGAGARWLSGNMVALYNPQPQFPCGEIRTIFRQEK